MITTEKTSENTKNDLISRAVERVKNNDMLEHFHMVRGNVYNTEKIHLLGVLAFEEITATVKGVVKACEKDSRSRHQVDYLISTFVCEANIGKISLAEGLTSEQRISKIKNVIDETLEKDLEKTLMILVMSKEFIEVITYGVIESSYKGETNVTVSPEPLMIIKEDASDSKVLIGSNILPNFFKTTSRENEILKSCNNLKLTQMFLKEALIFPNKSKFIEERDRCSVSKEPVKKKKVKFGY